MCNYNKKNIFYYKAMMENKDAEIISKRVSVGES
jgi:hypothetical protein